MFERVVFFLARTFTLLLLFNIVNFVLLDSAINFSGDNSRFLIKQSGSALRVSNVSDITGWSEDSIVKAFGDQAADQWIEGYASGDIIAQGTTNLIYSNSNALLYGIKNNSNALLKIDQDNGIQNNSNALLYGIKNNSNALLKIDQDNGIQNNSNALLYGMKNNSNALIKIDQDSGIQNNSNALLYGIKNNSNALIKIDQDDGIQNNSNALLYGIKNNSNALVSLDKDIENNSNALLYGIKNNSNATLNSIVEIKNNSNALLYGIKNNSNTILNLIVEIKNNSNALLYGIKNNSNALIKMDQDNGIQNNSNALLYGIKNNSNAILASGSEVVNNSNALVYMRDHFDYYTDHVVFHDGTTINTGFVRFNNGFTVNSDAIATLDTFITVSGGIDLNGTGKIKLLGSLFLDTNCSFSPGGGIVDGMGNSIVLSGNLALPNSYVLRFSSDTIIDGNGCELSLGNHAQLAIDNNVTLTLKNLILKNNVNPNVDSIIEFTGEFSSLALDNVQFSLAQDFPIYQGQLFVHNDVLFTGSSSLIHTSSSSIIVKPHSQFAFGPGTTFYYNFPFSTGAGIVLEDASSSIYVNGATLKTIYPVLRLTKGSLFLDNKVTLNTGEYGIYESTTTVTTGLDSSSAIYKPTWSHAGNFIALLRPSSLEVYEFDGTGFSFCATATLNSILSLSAPSWSFDDNYLAVIDDGDNRTKILSFDSVNKTLTFKATTPFTTVLMNSAAWNRDSSYIAVPSGSYSWAVYGFDGNEVSFIEQDDSIQVNNVAWGPNNTYIITDGRYIFKIFEFDGSTLHETYSKNVNPGYYGYAFTSDIWSPDGNYLVLTDSEDGTDYVVIYTFSAGAAAFLTRIDQTDFRGLYWHPNGKSILVEKTTADQTLFLEFYNSTLTQLTPKILTGTSINYNGDYLVGTGSLGVLDILSVNYIAGMAFGNSALGSDYDLDLNVLAGAYVELDGSVSYDNVN